MFFLVDVAHPWDDTPHWADGKPPWENQPVVVNLEGTLVGNAAPMGHRRLFNKPSILDALKKYNVQVLSLANNHAMDWPDQFEDALQNLKEQGFVTVGAGMNSEEAAQSVEIEENGRRIFFLAFGWETIECEAATTRKPGVNSLKPGPMLDSIRALRSRESEAVIAILPHWNYEMEVYPQPAHRQLAFAAIEAGADAVIGHHPHRVGGIEFHRGKLIAYSIGNFWLPQGVFFDGELRFAGDACLELAIEWRPDAPAMAHWFRYSPADHSLSHMASEPLTDSLELKKRSGFAGLGHDEYKVWFRANRVKRKLLPIYDNYQNVMGNRMRDRYVLLRHKGLVALERSGLRRLMGL